MKRIFRGVGLKMRDPIVGRPISDAIAVVTLAQAIALLARSFDLNHNWNEAFATLSNLAYVFSGIYAHYSETPRGGALVSPAFPLLLLGAGSLAFHDEPLLSRHAHTLDIYGGWLVVGHLACAALHAAVTEVLSECFARTTRERETYTRWIDVADWIFVAVLTWTVLLISLRYEAIYDTQLMYYLVCAGIAIVFALFSRTRLAKWKPLLSISTFSVLLESLALLGIAISAVALQGELGIGRRSTHTTDPNRYDLQHGMWHVLLALTVSLLNVRFRDILDQSRTIPPLNDQEYITTVPLQGLYGLGVFFVQSIVLVALKESDASEGNLIATLWVGTVLLSAHAAYSLWVKYRDWRAYSAAFGAAKRDQSTELMALSSLPL